MLFERNQKTVRLSIPSDVKHGYIIDYDRKYEKYFDKDGGGWRAWHKEKPKAVCNTQVSRPAYDKKSGLVLLYMGNQADALAGAGFVLLYKYENGRLKELGRVEVWIS